MQPEKNSVNKAFVVVLLGAFALAVIAGAFFVTILPGIANLQRIVTTAQSTGAPSASKVSTVSDGSDFQYYLNLLEQNLASHLGIDKTKLQAALQGALNDTVDQAVKDGKLDLGQATMLKAGASRGLEALLNLALPAGSANDFGTNPGNSVAPQVTPGSGNRGGNGSGIIPGGRTSPLGGRLGTSFRTIIDAAAQSIGITTSQLITELGSGKSLNDIATEHNVDPGVVKTAILSGVKAQLDSAVQDGTMDQSQADNVYNTLTQNIDSLMNGSLRIPSFLNPGGQGNSSNPGLPQFPGNPNNPSDLGAGGGTN